jgi:hypothetical protein
MGYGTGTTASSVLSMLATLKPGETTHDFTVKAAKGEYNLWFMFGDNSSGSAFGTGKMFIGYGADANKIKEGKLEFDGQEGATTLSVKSVNGQLAPVTGTFEIVNSSTNKYTNTYYLAVENGTTTYATASVAATVDGNSTETISFNLGTVTGLTSGTTYTIRLYKKNGDTLSIDVPGVVLKNERNASRLSTKALTQDRFLSYIKRELTGNTDSLFNVNNVDITIAVCNEDLNAYISSQNNRNTSGGQEYRSYSNIQGGVGVFGARRAHVRVNVPCDSTGKPDYIPDQLRRLGVGFYGNF